MLPYQTPADAVAERKSVRMEQRVKPTVKRTIEEAATVLGVDVADFVSNEAYRSAEAVLARQEVTRLSPEDRAMILGLLASPPAPTPALAGLMGMGDEIVI